jgi:DNA-binding GntR family transcriptional regulator
MAMRDFDRMLSPLQQRSFATMKSSVSTPAHTLIRINPIDEQPLIADSLKSQVVERLKERIFTGSLRPGSALRELHLARSFQVSQATIREALLQLEQMGLAVRQANRGTTVVQLSPADVVDRLEIRSRLEPLACVRAAAHLDEADFEYLEQLAAEISRYDWTRDHNFYEISQFDFQFHRYIWRRSGSTVLCTTLEQVTLPLFAFIGLLRQVGAQEQRPGDSHRPLIEALRSRKTRAITQAVRRHFQASYDQFTRLKAEEFQALLNSQAS